MSQAERHRSPPLGENGCRTPATGRSGRHNVYLLAKELVRQDIWPSRVDWQRAWAVVLELERIVEDSRNA